MSKQATPWTTFAIVVIPVIAALLGAWVGARLSADLPTRQTAWERLASFEDAAWQMAVRTQSPSTSGGSDEPARRAWIQAYDQAKSRFISAAASLAEWVSRDERQLEAVEVAAEQLVNLANTDFAKEDCRTSPTPSDWCRAQATSGAARDLSDYSRELDRILGRLRKALGNPLEVDRNQREGATTIPPEA
ncbi:MptD family putative ECF transporter S component [Candidatus Binatia bacterium]|nr:MptD family putative ECF transporter S component [Candidatus Binatia bacterium]